MIRAPLPTEKIYVIDTDGNNVAIFHGYNCPSYQIIFATYPSAVKCRVFTRRNQIKETIVRGAVQ